MSVFRKKLAIQFIATNGATAASFLLSIVLARLLSPSEVGIFSMTAVLVGFAHVFRDFGVAAFIRRQKELTPELLASAAGVMMCSAWTIALVLYLSAGWWARYFAQPGIHEVMQVLALGFVFIPFGAIPQAVMSRNMEVEKQALITVFSTTVYFTTCVTLAYAGFSYMSMAWANLANIIVSGIGFTLLRPPGMPNLPSFRGWKQVAHFGAGAMLTSSLKAVDTALPDMLLGKLSGPHAVGIYSRSNSTVNILNYVAGPTINYVALPYLAKVHHDGHSVGHEVGRAVAYLTGVLWPALIVTALMAPDIVVFLYGQAWLESAAIVPWLCAACAAQITFSVVQPALTGMGRPYLTAAPVILVLIAKVGLALSLYDGTLASYARAVAIAEALSIPIYLYLTRRHLHLRTRDWARWLAPSTGLTLGILLQMWIYDEVLGSIVSPFFSLLTAALWVVPGWVFCLYLLKHPLAKEITLFVDAVTLRWKAASRPSFLTAEAVQTEKPVTASPLAIIYGAVTTPPPPHPNVLTDMRLRFALRFRRLRDLMLWKFKLTTRLNYRNYLLPHSYNIGDYAIAQSTKNQFARQSAKLNFVDVNWGSLATDEYKKSVEQADMLVVAGSGYVFISAEGQLAPRVKLDLATFSQCPVKLVLCGIGVNQPVGADAEGKPMALDTGDEATLRQLLMRASVISVRDVGAQQLLQRYTDKPVRLTGDPALYYTPISESSLTPPPGRPLIGINFAFHGPLSTRLLKRNLPRYAEMLKGLQQRTGCRFRYFVHFDTERIIPRLLRSMGIHMEVIRGEPATLAKAYQQLNLHIGGMLHSCILSASAGTPCIALAYDIKHAGFFNVIGLSDYCFNAADLQADQVVNTAVKALLNEAALRKTIFSHRQQLQIEFDSFVHDCVSLAIST